ncbi:hypothetical protein [Compostimonas suwonensis]|uniref:hypothetical protein n=1 Tax=Compostimonas suwonensis TaxID=1048394 RepID=UPI0012FD5AFC|nr:hypothetical protein [Compostimonas suwonensis]
MSDLNEHLARVQDVVARARDFRSDEGSNPKEFSRTVVEDLAVLADAVTELIKRAKS